jgi:ribosomal protein S18 acetylase RimI-like enzyme
MSKVRVIRVDDVRCVSQGKYITCTAFDNRPDNIRPAKRTAIGDVHGVSNGKKKFFTTDIEIHPDYRRQGHGRALVDAIELEAKNKFDAKCFVADDVFDLHPNEQGFASAFWENQGYQMKWVTVKDDDGAELHQMNGYKGDCKELGGKY